MARPHNLNGGNPYNSKLGKTMKKSILIAAVLLATGCTAQPFFYYGKYYMAGDSKCRNVSYHNETTINCVNSDGEIIGRRTALTSQQLNMWNAQQNRAATAAAAATISRPKTTNCTTTYGYTHCTTN